MKKRRAYFFPLIRCILFIIFGLSLALITGKRLADLSYLWTVVGVVVSIIIIVILLFICKKEGKSYKEIMGLKKPILNKKTIAFVLVSMLVLGMGGMYGFGFLIYGKDFMLETAVMVQPLPIWLAIVMIIILPVVTTLAEDGLYLAYSLRKMEEVSNNKYLIVLYPMFFYALQHSFIPLIFDAKFIVYRFLCFLPLAIAMGFWYYKKHDIAPIMIGHWVLNIFTCQTILLASIYPDLFL